ncbi:hypothetical protein O181_093732, partial [Austropuccinia psidii MF-1]|nr:hypothetical protein [Austropuccinia psidii MF-1]
QSIINIKSNSSNSNSKLKQILNSSNHHSKTSINSNQNFELNMNISSSQNQSHLLTKNTFDLNNNSNPYLNLLILQYNLHHHHQFVNLN